MRKTAMGNNDAGTVSPFNNMGKPIPEARKQAAYDCAKAMGIESADERMGLVGTVANYLERDQPYEAQQAALKRLDVTGMYRLIAVLLTA
jgi:hypothetical protein